MHIYLKLTIKSYASNEELKKEKFNYSTIIAGSDQCWNILCEDGDDSYFINFVDGCNINKVAYAPSLGSTNIKKNTKDLNKYVNYLNQFNVLSVREKNAKIWLEDLTGKHVELLVDPTLLFDKRQWLKMFNIEKKEHTNFIFYYAFKYDPEVNIIVKKIAKKYKKDIYIIDAKAWVRNALWRNGFKISQSGGPLEFLKMMYSADMVLTTSFHGTAFSAIFHKNFWFLNSNMHSPDDDRATSLLRQIGLEHRFLDIKNIKKTDLLENIDYSVVDQRIKHEQYKSFDYLKKFVY